MLFLHFPFSIGEDKDDTNESIYWREREYFVLMGVLEGIAWATHLRRGVGGLRPNFLQAYMYIAWSGGFGAQLFLQVHIACVTTMRLLGDWRPNMHCTTVLHSHHVETGMTTSY